VPTRAFAIYPDVFIHPVFRDADQQKLKESGDAQRYAFIPVRPAKTGDTSSVFYDELYNKVVNHIMRAGDKKLAIQIMEKVNNI
jgi:hypothetical protein